jgi:sugar phosphate isomerase/epimerase
LCDAAADRDLSVALEYPAMATLGDVATAWAIVERAGRANGGIVHDVWHHDRSTATDADLDAVPADRFLSIQLSDASAERRGPPIEDARYRRLVGEGDLNVVEGLRRLVARGVRCPIGIEVFVSFDLRPVDERIREFADNLRWAATAAGLTTRDRRSE